MIVIISESSGQMICTLLWPRSSFNMFSDSLDTWLSFHSSALSYFPRRRQGSIVVPTVWTLAVTSSHLAPGWPSQLEAVWLTLGAASRAGFRPAVLHVEMERVSIVFDAVHNPGGRGVKRREAGVNVTVELFQLSIEPADDPGMCHESCSWQRPMWVWTWGEEPSLEGRTPELSEPALTHIQDLLDDLGIHYEYRWLGQEDKVLW